MWRKQKAFPLWGLGHCGYFKKAGNSLPFERQRTVLCSSTWEVNQSTNCGMLSADGVDFPSGLPRVVAWNLWYRYSTVLEAFMYRWRLPQFRTTEQSFRYPECGGIFQCNQGILLVLHTSRSGPFIGQQGTGSVFHQATTQVVIRRGLLSHMHTGMAHYGLALHRTGLIVTPFICSHHGPW